MFQIGTLTFEFAALQLKLVFPFLQCLTDNRLLLFPFRAFMYKPVLSGDQFRMPLLVFSESRLPFDFEVGQLLLKSLLAVVEFAFTLFECSLAFRQFRGKVRCSVRRRCFALASHGRCADVQHLDFDRSDAQPVALAQLGIGESTAVQSGIGSPTTNDRPLFAAEDNAMERVDTACVQSERASRSRTDRTLWRTEPNDLAGPAGTAHTQDEVS